MAEKIMSYFNEYRIVDEKASTKVAEMIATKESDITPNTEISISPEGSELIFPSMDDILQVSESIKKKISKPIMADNNKFPRAKDGDIEWVEYGLPTDYQTEIAVRNWLDAHPEATTTVQDRSLGVHKMTMDTQIRTVKDYVTPEMFGAYGDGETDDIEAIKIALESGKPVHFVNSYLVSETITVPKNTELFFESNSSFVSTASKVFKLQRNCSIKGLNIVCDYKNEIVFEVLGDNSGQGAMNILVEDVNLKCISIPDTFTVYHLYSSKENPSYWGVSIRGGKYKCIAGTDKNSDYKTYFARVYSKNGFWLSTCIFDGCIFENFKWGFFFCESEDTMLVRGYTDADNAMGKHIIINCSAQATNAYTLSAFVFIPKNVSLVINNNSPWDYGSFTGSQSLAFLVEEDIYTTTTKIESQEITFGTNASILRPDGSIVKNPYNMLHLYSCFSSSGRTSFNPLNVSALECINLQYKNPAENKCFALYLSSASVQNRHFIFYIANGTDLFKVDLLNGVATVPPNFPTNLHFAYSKLYNNVYIYSDAALGRALIILYSPLLNGSTVNYSMGGQTQGSQYSILNCNAHGRKVSELYLSSLPAECHNAEIKYAKPQIKGSDGIYELGIENGNVVATKI